MFRCYLKILSIRKIHCYLKTLMNQQVREVLEFLGLLVLPDLPALQ
jgi:hypothetical protein